MTATTHAIRKQSKQAALVSGDKPAIRFIKRQEVEGITGLSCTEIYRRIAADNFPKQVTLGPKCVVWIEAEIHGWMSERIAESREVAA
ncbi:AlpA family phage regulatory protein [Pseudomonas wadenswilerensis]|uniref:AlpA family phage regulatory protein n=1 Tax=Pseudomonas wadenswilerensis TaxID=1785161 RepID=UPI003207E59C